jgi:hypothetical protein
LKIFSIRAAARWDGWAQQKVGEEVEIVGFRETRKTVVTGVEMFKQLMKAGRRQCRPAAARNAKGVGAAWSYKGGSIRPTQVQG